MTTTTTAPTATERPLSVDLHGATTRPAVLLRQLWKSRELGLILTRKEFHVRYRRASLGLLWALGLPLLQSAVLAVVFSHVTHIKGAPHYAVFVLSGMTAWVFFTAALAMGSTSIVDGTELSSRVYFPRALMPLVQVGANLYGYAVAVVLLLVLSPVLGVPMSPRVVLLLPATALLIVLTCGFCLVNSALHVYFRDIRYLVAATLLVWMYVTPVIYPATDAPHALRTLIDVNPMSGVVDLFHAAVLGSSGPLALAVGISCAWAAALAAAGLVLQCRFDRVFADLL